MVRPHPPRFAALAALSLLAGCATVPPARVAPAPSAAPPPSREAGLGQVMGAEAPALTRLFGPAALDLKEGTARKLQFRGAACVLDAYLYPPQPGGIPRVTWVDSRTPLGLPIDRASCVAALSARAR